MRNVYNDGVPSSRCAEDMHRCLQTDAQNRCADEASKYVTADGSAKGQGPW